jgi:hypothetical protein
MRRVLNLQKFPIFEAVEVKRMWDTCAVDLRINLPKTVAAEVEEVQRTNPEMLSRMVYYAITRRTIFDHLVTWTRAGGSSEFPGHARERVTLVP